MFPASTPRRFAFLPWSVCEGPTCSSRSPPSTVPQTPLAKMPSLPSCWQRNHRPGWPGLPQATSTKFIGREIKIREMSTAAGSTVSGQRSTVVSSKRSTFKTGDSLGAMRGKIQPYASLTLFSATPSGTQLSTLMSLMRFPPLSLRPLSASSC